MHRPPPTQSQSPRVAGPWRYALAVLLCLGVTGACTDTYLAEDDPATTSDAAHDTAGADTSVGTDASTGGDAAPSDAGNADATDAPWPVDPNGGWAPNANRQGLAVCTPQPIDLRELGGIDLHARVLEAEADGRTLVSGEGEGEPMLLETAPPTPGEFLCDHADCWTALPSFALAWDEVPSANWWDGAAVWQRRESWTGVAMPARHDETGELRVLLRANRMGSTAVVDVVHRFDAAGHLLRETYRFDGNLWFELEQTWDGDRMVRAVRTDHINGTGVQTYDYTYDAAGRMRAASATRLDDGTTADAVWRYDAAGRPIGVERTIDGEPLREHTWRWDEDTGRLASHSAARTQRSPFGGARMRVDDHQSDAAQYFQEAWDLGAGGVSDDGRCWRVPTGIGHGYPVAERVYDLGWTVGRRPAGIDRSYGAPALYVSLQETWYGHGGVAHGYTVGPLSPTSWVSAIETVYDARGWAVLETLEGQTSEGEAGTWTRRRTIGPHGVAVDVLSGREGESTITIERDSEGRVVRRTAHVDDELVGEHLWERDGAGHTVRHAVANVPDRNAFDEEWPKIDDLPDELPLHREHLRRYGNDWFEEIGADGPTGHIHRFDAEGRLIEETQGNHRFDWEWAPGRDVWTRRDAFDLGEGAPRIERRRTLEDGVLVERSITYHDHQANSWHEVFSYE